MIRRRAVVEVAENKPRGFDSFDVSLGDILRGERATLGKSLLDIQKDLKIKAAYIVAIENADVEAFEMTGFIAGYVRSYARYLKLDPEWAYKKFCDESGFSAPGGSRGTLDLHSKSSRYGNSTAAGSNVVVNGNIEWLGEADGLFSKVEPGALGGMVALVLLACGLGFGGWSVLKEIQRVDLAPIEIAAESTPLPNLVDPLQTDVVVANVETVAAVPSADDLERLYRPKALDAPVLASRDAPISMIDPKNVGVLAQNSIAIAAPVVNHHTENGVDAVLAAAESVAPQVLAEDTAEISIFAVRAAWIQVQSSGGTVLFDKILDAGESYTLPKTEQAPVLRTGNAGSVYFAVNGVAYGPSGDGAAVEKNIQLSEAALVSKYEPANHENDTDLATYVAQLEQ